MPGCEKTLVAQSSLSAAVPCLGLRGDSVRLCGVSDNVTTHLQKLFATPEPPDLGPGPRKGVLPPQEIDAVVESALAEAKLSSVSLELARALALLWHDHLAAAHTISQAIENPDGSLVHAIMHRREPDYWNSKYWWRRVGQHPCFAQLGARVRSFLGSRGERELCAKLVPRGSWDPFAFVDACEAAVGQAATSEWVQRLREVQRLETEVALAHFLRDDAR